MTTCDRDLSPLYETNDLQLLGNFMSYCEDNCLNQGVCQSYSQLHQRWMILNGEAGECKCCGEIYNYEDMNEAGYCDRCQRAEKSRC